MPRAWRLHRSAVILLTIVALSIAGLLCWALVSLAGWLGVTIIGLATLLMAYPGLLDEDNATPISPTGANGVYKAQYEGLFGRLTPERRLSDSARRAQFSRVLYVIRIIGLTLLLLGLCMFVYHQL